MEQGKISWKARIKMLWHLVEARNLAIALGFDTKATDIGILIHHFIRAWDRELRGEGD